jgi:hypothetical protein
MNNTPVIGSGKKLVWIPAFVDADPSSEPESVHGMGGETGSQKRLGRGRDH